MKVGAVKHWLLFFVNVFALMQIVEKRAVEK